MALIDREVGLAVAATAGFLSPRARDAMRKGAVYGLAGMMKAGDVVVGTARGAVRGASEGVSGSGGTEPSSASESTTAGTPAAVTTTTTEAGGGPVAEPATPSGVATTATEPDPTTGGRRSRGSRGVGEGV